MPTSRPRISRNALVLAFVAFASGFGQDLVSPILPGFLALLQMSKAQIGLIDGLLQGTWNICRFLSGWLSDRFNRRKEFVFFGYALSSVTRPLLAFTSSFLPIALLRIFDGAGKGTKDAPRDALIAAEASAKTSGRTFGFQRMIDTGGSVFGPLTAFALLAMLSPALSTYRFIFALAAIPGAVALALIWFGVREPATLTAKKTNGYGKLPWQFWLFTVGTSIAMLTKINDSLFLIRAQDLGVTRTLIPLLFGGFTLLYAALSYPIGIWTDRIGKMPVLAAGWFVLALVEFGFSFDPTIVGTLFLFACYGLFFALTEGSGRAFIADAVDKSSHGTAYSVYYTVTGVSLIVGGYLLGLVWDRDTPELAFRIAAAGSLLGGLVLLTLLKRGFNPRNI
jgi:MFS family permease